MSVYGGNGQFGGIYDNPQTGGKSMGTSFYGGGGTQEQRYNQGQAAASQGFGPSQYQSAGFDPQNPFGTTYQSTNALQPDFQMTPQMIDNQAFDRWNSDPFRDFLSPGLRDISMTGGPMGNMDVFMQNGTKNIQMGQGNRHWAANAAGPGGPGGSPDVPGAYEGGQYQPQSPWGGYEFDVSELDPNKAIRSWEPYMAEQRERGFAEAGQRMGQSGMTASTPYAEALGGVARKSTDDLGRIAAEYQYRAQESMAQRDLQRQMAEQGAGLSAWGQQGNWGHQGQLADLARDFGAWQTEGGWQQQANQNQANRDLSQWQTQQQMDQNNQNMMMAMMGQFMGGY